MNRFLIVTNKLKDPDNQVTDALAQYLQSKGLTAGTDINDTYDCCLALGGDGTIINTVRRLKTRDIPVLGINLGHLGFMSSIERSEINQAIDKLINGDYYIEERMMITARHIRQGTVTENEWLALNDVVINRMGFSRIVCVRAYVNDALVNTYLGDGIIIATPTGSTGYNLSAGGPIVTPEAELMVVTPICPHSLNLRSVVVSANDTVRVFVDTSRDSSPEKAVMTIDGQEPVELENGDGVEVCRSAKKAKLIRFNERGFFKVLHMKLSV
ncbi:MAG: NAD(+)/NADH kinase [Lachnospiraceae bacterium]|nr:NAD(+)/NADH kinase [Lachnospiraceae bacterium]